MKEEYLKYVIKDLLRKTKVTMEDNVITIRFPFMKRRWITFDYFKTNQLWIADIFKEHVISNYGFPPKYVRSLYKDYYRKILIKKIEKHYEEEIS